MMVENNIIFDIDTSIISWKLCECSEFWNYYTNVALSEPVSVDAITDVLHIPSWICQQTRTKWNMLFDFQWTLLYVMNISHKIPLTTGCNG